jgi:lysophospholipase L1-like esterase
MNKSYYFKQKKYNLNQHLLFIIGILGICLIIFSVYGISQDKINLVKGSEMTEQELETRPDNSCDLYGKTVAVLGDSIMMLQRTSSINTNGIIDQDKLDLQDWDELKYELGLNDLINLGLGGATVFDKGEYDTEYPQPEGNSSYLTNEVRWLLRQVNENNREIPDCIMIWIGTNGAGKPSEDNYDEIMNLTYDELIDDSNKAYRETFYGGLRTSLEMIYRNFPYSTVFIFSPIQTNPSNYRTYEKLSTTRDALEKMSNRYSCIFVDALNEIGIVDFYENNLKDGSSRFLSDGLHPNSDGKIIYKNYTAKRLKELYFSKS